MSINVDRTRVLIVEDSPSAAMAISRALKGFDIVGIARDAIEALKMEKRLRPDVITMDIKIPHGDGLQLTRKILARRYVPIIILSARISPDEQQLIFEALAAGACDVVPKSRFFSSDAREGGGQKLANLVHAASRKSLKISAPAAHSIEERSPPKLRPRKELKAVLIGASTGGTNALRQILEYIPTDYPLPILVAQHMGTGFMDGFVQWLASELDISIKLAESGEMAKNGTVYLPPSDHDLIINSALQIGVKRSEGSSCTPCVNKLFLSGIRAFGPNAAYLLLTGMGSDGAQSLARAKETGALTAVQNEESCVIYGMPREALHLCPSHLIIALDAIGPWLASLSN